jgi:hypothetical protein
MMAESKRMTNRATAAVKVGADTKGVRTSAISMAPDSDLLSATRDI